MKKIFNFILLTVMMVSLNMDLNAQVKIDESFESVTFPPTGWTAKNILGAANWVRSTAQAHTGTASAFITYQSTGGNDWLVTKQFTVGASDTLSFWIRRQFSSAFPPDNMDILLSTTDTAVASFSNTLGTINVATLANATWVKYSYYLGGLYNGNDVYIAFKHTDSDGNGCWVDDVKVGNPLAPVTDDMGVTAATFGVPGQVLSAGKGYDLTATVINYGINTQNVVPVYYTVNGGSPVGPVNTVGPIDQDSTEDVVFTGGNAFIPVVGTNVVRIYTALVGDGDATNDTAIYSFDVLAKISIFPYTETFDLANGWTITGGAPWQLGLCVNPDGVPADQAAVAAFYSIGGGVEFALRSPEMDFSGISNPVLDFYVAYRTYTGGETDQIEVLVSTDGGLTFNPASTPYSKTWSTDPSLATLVPSSGGYVPAGATEWRHETVDLSNVGNMGNVVIGFVATSDFGNNGWIDNVIVSEPNSLCTDAVTGPGTYNCNSIVSLNFTATPLPPPAGNHSTTDTKANEKNSIETSGNFMNYDGSVKINSGNSFDNPNGGTAFVSQYTNNDPGQNIAVNTTATAPDATISTPTNVYHDFWFTVTYDGNDYQGYATYDISIDISGTGFTIPNALYIVKRTDRTGAWVCQNTTLAGNILTVTGLTDFCDFGLAGMEALPVELASFVSATNGRNVELNWATASETNNSGFDIERSSANGSWTKIANVSGNGTSAISHSYSYTDRNLASGNYSYRLKQIDFNGNFEYFNLNNEVIVGVPSNFSLSQNYPNPFNPSTKINFDLPVDGNVSLKIFDMSGKEVMTLVNEVRTAGYYSVNFNGASLSSGIYFYTIQSGSFVSTKKMTLIK
jgi:hypothetical protein